MPLKSAVASGWKTMPATFLCFRSRDVSIVTWAVVIANRRSGAGVFSFLRPPRSASRNPTRWSLEADRLGLGGQGRHAGGLELRLDARQRLDPLLHRRVRH